MLKLTLNSLIYFFKPMDFPKVEGSEAFLWVFFNLRSFSKAHGGYGSDLRIFRFTFIKTCSTTAITFS